jgi:hypothetical protein
VENIYFDKSKITSSVIDRYYELALREGNRQAFIDRFTTTKDTTAYRDKNNSTTYTGTLGAKDLLIPLENAINFTTTY